mgnify:CR=1 FL=1|tara:strand:+ start:4362 stop:5276 length:915 start_codon:yes stop_codon:yes gene_type:complete
MIDPFVNPSHVQGSDAWLDERRKHVTASEAATILGISPWMTPYELWMDKMGLGTPVEVNDVMSAGNDNERIARSAVEKRLGLEFFPICIYNKEHPFMMASMDGVTLDAQIEKRAVEIKCGSKTHRLALEGEISDYYMAQMQHQLACLDIDMIYYYSFYNEFNDFDEAAKNAVLIEVTRDDIFIENMIEKEREFWKLVKTQTPPALTDKDYVDRENIPLWINAGYRLSEISNEMKILESEKKTIRDYLIKDAGNNSCCGGGVKLSRSFPAGRVNYNSIPELENVDLDEYRSTPKLRWTLTVGKKT